MRGVEEEEEVEVEVEGKKSNGAEVLRMMCVKKGEAASVFFFAVRKQVNVVIFLFIFFHRV